MQIFIFKLLKELNKTTLVNLFPFVSEKEKFKG